MLGNEGKIIQEDYDQEPAKKSMAWIRTSQHQLDQADRLYNMHLAVLQLEAPRIIWLILQSSLLFSFATNVFRANSTGDFARNEDFAG